MKRCSAEADTPRLASFQAAIREGANAIESDVHATSDGVVLMFHDPTLDRTTTGKGLIREQPWAGVIEYVFCTRARARRVSKVAAHTRGGEGNGSYCGGQERQREAGEDQLKVE